MAESNVRTLVVPTSKAVMTLEELKAELVKEGATGVQRDLGPGGEDLYPCMGTAGVYVNEPASKEQKLNDAAHVIEEGWPGSGRYTEIPGSNVHHHTTVAPHVFTADEMVPITDLASVAEVFNVTPTKKLTKLAGAETDMLGDLKSNDAVEAIMLTDDTGIVVLFTKPTHLLETMALIFDPLAATAITDTGTLTYSLDTTDGMDGTWHPIHGHIVDVSGMPSVAIDGKLPASIKPLMTNLEGVKAVKIFGPHLMVNLVELRFWIPKADVLAPVVTP